MLRGSDMSEAVVGTARGLPEWSYVPADTSEPILDTTVGGVLREVAARCPDRMALVEGISPSEARKTWTYAELLADAETVARALAARFEYGPRTYRSGWCWSSAPRWPGPCWSP